MNIIQRGFENAADYIKSPHQPIFISQNYNIQSILQLKNKMHGECTFKYKNITFQMEFCQRYASIVEKKANLIVLNVQAEART